MGDEALTIIGLSIERSLIPEWFEAVREVAAKHARRMSVIDKPDGYVVQVELPVAGKEAFASALTEAWDAFVATRKAQGRWDEG